MIVAIDPNRARMQDTLPFLDRLALGPDADVRAIRRAYAREVKLIDQGREAAQFQELRDAYETALQWAAYEAHLAAQADGDAAVERPVVDEEPPVAERPMFVEPLTEEPLAFDPTVTDAVSMEPPPATPGTNKPPLELREPPALASIAFDQFIAARVALTTGRLLDDVAVWMDALRQRLDSDDLINIEARAHFESMIARLLVQGWHAGHHTLLQAAAGVFQWDSDQRRLRQFGQLGANVNQAIEESHQFTTQRLKDHTIERDVLDRLRLRDVPDNTYLRRYIMVVEHMLARYPAFMAITVNPATIGQWQARLRAEEQALAPEEIAAPYDPEKRANAFRAAMWWIVFSFVLLGVLAMVANHFYKPAPAGFYPPNIHPELANPSPPDSDSRPRDAQQPTDAQLKNIQSRLHYRAQKAARQQALNVEFMVYVSATGEVVAIDKRVASEDPAFDNAVGAAIRDTKTFAATSVAYKFPLSYTWAPGKRPAK